MDIDDVKGIAQIYMSMQEKADDDTVRMIKANPKMKDKIMKGLSPKARKEVEKALGEEKVKYPHMMYDPKTGKEVEAKTPEDHEKYAKMGYTHDKPKEDASNDKSDDGEGLDKVDKKALKKKFKDRKDKDIDNDGDVDDSDEYLHKRRKAISKAVESKKDFVYAAKKAKENGDKTFVFAGKTYKCEDYDDKGNLKEDKQMFVYHIRDVKQKEGNIHARSKMEAAVKARDNGFRPPMSVIMKGPYVKEEAMNEDKKSHAASPKADMIEPETDGKNAKAAADTNKKVKDQHKVDVKDRPDADKQDGSDKTKEAPKPKTLKDVRK